MAQSDGTGAYELLHSSEELLGSQPRSGTEAPPNPLQRSPQVDVREAASETSGVFLAVYAVCVSVMLASTLWVCSSHWGDCSVPLEYWSVVHVLRHVGKCALFAQKLRCHRSSEGRVPRALMVKIRILELLGVAWWVTGLYWLSACRVCARPVLTTAMTLFLIQTFFLVMPCIVFLLVLCCLPAIVWLIPYVVPPNPNQVATAEDVIEKIRPAKFAEVMPKVQTSVVEPTCAICLAEFESTDEVMSLPCDPVRHVFHSSCVTSWLRISQLCPICRSNVPALLAQTSDDAAALPPDSLTNQSGGAPVRVPGSESDFDSTHEALLPV